MSFLNRKKNMKNKYKINKKIINKNKNSNNNYQIKFNNMKMKYQN